MTGMTAADEGLQRQHGATRRACSRFVLTAAFLLLLVTFRSIVIPIKAILLNLLSVGAAYGVLVLVFQTAAGRGAARLRVDRGDHVVAAAVPVRGPVRPVDGLPRVHPQPGARGVRPGMATERRGRPGHQDDRLGGHERGHRDGRGVRDLRDALQPRLQADGGRVGRGGADRRHDHPRRAAAGHDEAARRLELVPAEVARVAAGGHARARRGTGSRRA